MSDTWDEERVEALSELDGNEELYDGTKAFHHRFVINRGCHWKDLRGAAENHGVLVQQITRQVEDANPEKLGGIFGSAPWADHQRMPPERLRELIEHLSRHTIAPSRVSHDMLGACYEYLLQRFSGVDAESAGQFFTPRPVVHLLVRILDPQPRDTIYDPACGSAGMLIGSAHAVKAAGNSMDWMRFYGQEVNQTSSAIGRMNLYVHDLEEAKIRRGDTLRDPKFVDDLGKLRTFDVVIANPPFSLKNWGQEGWASDPHRRSEYGGVPPKSFGDMAWLQHMLASAAPGGGRVGVVMPHGVLFRSGAEKKIRRHLIGSDLLETVIGLGPNLFYGTTIPACLLILRKAKDPVWAGKVRIIDGSKQFVDGRNQNELGDDDVDAIHSAYADSAAEPARVKQVVVGHDEIEANDWDLNIGRYIEQEPAEVIDVEAALADMRRAEAATATAQAAMHKRLAAAGYA